jgi:hypothetical protein
VSAHFSCRKNEPTFFCRSDPNGKGVTKLSPIQTASPGVILLVVVDLYCSWTIEEGRDR